MISIKTPKRFAEAVVLDLLAFPGIFMSKKQNALWHLKHVCPRCSSWRKKFRDPQYQERDYCIWNIVWKQKRYTFSKTMGFLNWVRYYCGMPTNLSRYEKEFKSHK